MSLKEGKISKKLKYKKGKQKIGRRKSLSFPAVFFCYADSLPEDGGCAGMGEAIALSSPPTSPTPPDQSPAPIYLLQVGNFRAR